MTEPGSQITVRNVGPLQGTIRVPGAKNSVLKLMAASLLADGVYELTNVPDLTDVSIMGELLDALGVSSHRPEPGVLVMTNRGGLIPSRRTSWSSGSGRRSTSSDRC